MRFKISRAVSVRTITQVERALKRLRDYTQPK